MVKYRLVVQVTDDQGTVRDEELVPLVVAEAGWQCTHALWPAWVMGEEPPVECGWCHAPLVTCEMVECPWCEWYVLADQVIAHWAGGCED